MGSRRFDVESSTTETMPGPLQSTILDHWGQQVFIPVRRRGNRHHSSPQNVFKTIHHAENIQDAVLQQNKTRPEPEYFSCQLGNKCSKGASQLPIVFINLDPKAAVLVEIAKESTSVVYIERHHLFANKDGSDGNDLSEYVQTLFKDLRKDLWIFVGDILKHPEHTECLHIIRSITCIRREAMSGSDLPLSSFPVQVITAHRNDTHGSLTQSESTRFLSLPKQSPKEIAVFIERNYHNREMKIRNMLGFSDIGAFCEVTIVLSIGHSEALTQEDLPYIEDAYSALKELLDDPNSAIRQQMHHWFKIPNVRVSELLKQDPDQAGNIKMHMVVELRPLDLRGFSVMLEQIQGGILGTTIEETLKVRRQPFAGVAQIKGRDDQLQSSRMFFKRHEDNTKKRCSSLESSSGQVMSLLTIVMTALYKEHITNNTKLPADFLQILRDQGCLGHTSEIRSREGRNAMHMAIGAGRSDFLKMLLYMGKWGVLREDVIIATAESPVAVTHLGFTPRRLAEALAFTTKGQALLDDYDSLDRNYLGLSTLSKASLTGRLDLVKILIEARPDVLNETGSLPALVCASGADHPEIVDYLIKKRVTSTIVVAGQDSCSHVAAMFGNSKVIRTLEPHLVDLVGRKNENLYNAIDYCVMNGDLDSLRMFREKKIRIDAKTLLFAVRYSRKATLDFLLDECALSVDSGADHDGWTAVHQTTLSGDVPTLTKLMHRGADLTRLDKFGKNVFHLAAEYDQSDILLHIVQITKESGKLVTMINAQDYYTGKDVYYLIRGRDRGRRAWHWLEVQRMHTKILKDALTRGQLDVAQHGTVLFSGYGTTPDEDTNNKLKERQESALKAENQKPDMTPLHHATNKQHLEVVKVLLDHGADPNVQDYYGATPAHHAVMRGNLQVLVALAEKGADLGIRTTDGKSVADVAEENGHQHIMNYLEGNVAMTASKKFILQTLVKIKTDLNTDVIMKKRAHGMDIRRHVIDALRGLSIDINAFLLALGSGPVLEATSEA